MESKCVLTVAWHAKPSPWDNLDCLEKCQIALKPLSTQECPLHHLTQRKFFTHQEDSGQTLKGLKARTTIQKHGIIVWQMKMDGNVMELKLRAVDTPKTHTKWLSPQQTRQEELEHFWHLIGNWICEIPCPRRIAWVFYQWEQLGSNPLTVIKEVNALKLQPRRWTMAWVHCMLVWLQKVTKTHKLGKENHWRGSANWVIGQWTKKKTQSVLCMDWQSPAKTCESDELKNWKCCLCILCTWQGQAKSIAAEVRQARCHAQITNRSCCHGMCPSWSQRCPWIFLPWLTLECHKMCKSGAIFIDCGTKCVFLMLVVNLTAGEAFGTKREFETKLESMGMAVVHCHTDYGAFAPANFQDKLAKMKQNWSSLEWEPVIKMQWLSQALVQWFQ